MSYFPSISRYPIARRTFPVMAVCLHLVVLWLLVSSRFVHVQPPSLPPSVEVSLVFAPAPATPTPPAPVEPTQEPIPEPTAPVAPIPEPVKLPDPPPAVIPDPVVVPTPIKLPPPPVVVKPLPQPIPRLPDPPKPIPTPKPIPKPPEPKKSRINSAADIRQRNDFHPAQPRPVSVDPNKFKNSLLAAADSVRVSSRPTSPSTSPASAAQERDYESAVTAAMRVHWSEDFNASELSGPGRAALVRFVIRADGSIVSARIIRRSGVAAIDTRAARAIQAVRSFPAPKDYGIRSATYDVEFELTAKD